jgi:hypothetical protein
MTLLQHYHLSMFLTTAVTVGLGCWVFIQRRNSRVAQFFFLYALAKGWWSVCQGMAGFASDPASSLAWVRAMFYTVITFPVLLTHFFSACIGTDQRGACRLGWLLVIGFLPVLSTDLFLQEGGPVGFLSSFPRAGPLFLPFNLVWFGWILYDFWLLARAFSLKTQLARQQVSLLLVAFIFGYATGCTNYLYIYGMYLPLVQPFANYGCAIAWAMIAYDVFAYGLFDIRPVLRRSLVYSVLVTLLTVGYFGLVYAVERIFQMTLGYHSIGVSVAAFALMALAFQPLKVGIQRLVDWLLFRKPHEELVKRMERLEQEVRQADKLKAVSTLAAGMAHEIKNPSRPSRRLPASWQTKRTIRSSKRSSNA